MKKNSRSKIALKALFLVLAIACIAAPLASPFIFGSELSNAKDKLDDVKDNISNASNALKEGEKTSAELKAQISELEVKIYQADAEINVLTMGLNDTKDQVNGILQELEEVQTRLEEQDNSLLERLRAMYKNGSAGMMSVLLGSSSMTELLTNLELIKRVYNADAELMGEIEKEYSVVVSKKEELVALKELLEGQKSDLNYRKQAVAKDKTLLSSLKSKVDKNNALLESQIDELNKQANDLKAEILKLQSSGSYTGGSMCWPSQSSTRITSSFGNRLHPTLKVYKLHTGIDIGASKGTNILAANGGTVIKAEYYGGYGYCVMIDHGGGIVTLYGHSSKLLVKKGDKVKRGQVIALVGSTGNSTGPHLHFEVRVNGEYKQPLDYVTKGKYYYD